jgi:hypothetical protein
VATKKQRRRREKGRRHEYEYVYVDDEGQEVEVDEPEPKKAEARKAKPAGKNAPKNAPRAGRTVEPPSWNKVGRRGLLFAPFIVIFFYITRGSNESTALVLVRSLPLIVLIVPFMYAVDSMAYRSYQKRLEKRSGSPPKPK